MNFKTLPEYDCHKTVWAVKIDKMQQMQDGTAWIIPPVESGVEPFVVSADYVLRHNPEVGGYFVCYKDGYQSWSPARAFEEGYTLKVK